MVLFKVMIVKQSTHPNNILPKKKHILIIDLSVYVCAKVVQH